MSETIDTKTITILLIAADKVGDTGTCSFKYMFDSGAANENKYRPVLMNGLFGHILDNGEAFNLFKSGSNGGISVAGGVTTDHLRTMVETVIEKGVEGTSFLIKKEHVEAFKEAIAPIEEAKVEVFNYEGTLLSA